MLIYTNLSHNFPASGMTRVNPSKYDVIVQEILFNSPTEIQDLKPY